MKIGEFSSPIFSFTPNQLTLFSRLPSVDALLIHQFADCQRILFGLDSFADVDIVDAFAEPDADVALAAHIAVQDAGNFFSGLDFNASDADLPASLIFYDFAVAKG